MCTCAHDVVLGAAASCLAALLPLLMLLLLLLVGHRAASYLARFESSLGLHDICPLGSSQDRAGLFAVSYFSRHSGSPDYLDITWDRERMQQGGRVCCV